MGGAWFLKIFFICLCWKNIIIIREKKREGKIIIKTSFPTPWPLPKIMKGGEVTKIENVSTSFTGTWAAGIVF